MKRLIWKDSFCSHGLVNFSGMQLKGEMRTYIFFVVLLDVERGFPEGGWILIFFLSSIMVC